VARTSREGDRVESAVCAAGSVTLRNGACPFPARSDRHALPANECFDSSDPTELIAESGPQPTSVENHEQRPTQSHWQFGTPRASGQTERHVAGSDVARVPGNLHVAECRALRSRLCLNRVGALSLGYAEVATSCRRTDERRKAGAEVPISGGYGRVADPFSRCIKHGHAEREPRLRRAGLARATRHACGSREGDKRQRGDGSTHRPRTPVHPLSPYVGVHASNTIGVPLSQIFGFVGCVGWSCSVRLTSARWSGIRSTPDV
jgi:hypothetical protein